jgi:hypothetical protein
VADASGLVVHVADMLQDVASSVVVECDGWVVATFQKGGASEMPA